MTSDRVEAPEPTSPNEAAASVWQMAARVTSVGLQGAAFALIARLLGADALGGFAGAFALASLVGAASEFGLQATTVVELGRRPDRRGRTGAYSLLASLGLGLAGVLLALPLALLAFDGDAAVAFMALVPWAVISRMAVAGAAWFQSQLDFRRLFLVELLGRGAPVLGLGLILVIDPPWTPRSLLVVAGAVLAAGAVIQVAVACPGPLWAALAQSPDRARGALTMIRLALPVGVVAAISLVHVRADQILLEMLGRGGAELGRYAVGYRVVEGVAAVLGAVATVGFSAMARVHGEARVVTGRRYARVVPAVAATGGVGLVLTAPLLVALVGGSGFEGAVPVTRLLALVAVVSVVNMVPSLTIVAEGRSALLIPVGVVLVTANIGMNLALIPRHGIVGSAASTVATEIAGLIAMTYLARRQLPGSQQPWCSGVALVTVALAAVAVQRGDVTSVPLAVGSLAALGWLIVQARSGDTPNLSLGAAG